jgi:hypothetical protein
LNEIRLVAAGRDSYGAQDVIAYLSPFSNAASPAGVVST